MGPPSLRLTALFCLKWLLRGVWRPIRAGVNSRIRRALVWRERANFRAHSRARWVTCGGEAGLQATAVLLTDCWPPNAWPPGARSVSSDYPILVVGIRRCRTEGF